MKNIVILIKDDEGISLSNPMLNDLKDTFNILFANFRLGNSNLTDQLFENCAGYILEEYMKLNLQNISSPELRKHFKFSENKWYDFKYDNTQIKLLTFKENSTYSTTTLSSTQYENRKDMLFISMFYNISNNALTITEILVTDGKDIKVSNDKVLYSSIIIPPVIPEEPEENNENLTALRLVFTSNIQGNVQILESSDEITE